MLKIFYPDAYMDSTYKIDFEAYFRQGYRGILFDIDNTLVPHGKPAAEQAEQFFRELRKIGFQTCLISNNKEPRVSAFGAKVDSPYISNAHKPSIKNYRKAMVMMGTNRSQTIFVGDQLFTDVWGAKRTGIYSILVKPIHPKEEIQIVMKRFFEKIVLRSYKKHLKGKEI